MSKEEIDNFWWNVSIYRKYEWINNFESPIELEFCSKQLKKYVEIMNYKVEYYGTKYYLYPKPNAVVVRPA